MSWASSAGGWVGGGCGGEAFDEPAGDAGGEERLSGGDDPHGVEDVLGPGVFEEEPAGAVAQRLVHVVVEVEGGEHDDPRAGEVRVAGDPPGGLEPVESGHADVHQEHVGPGRLGDGDGVVAVVGFADEFEVVGVADHRGEAGAHERLVVGDGDADGHVDAGLTGRRALTTNPPWGSGPAVSSPPWTAARSRMPTRPCPPAATVEAVACPSSRTSTSHVVVGVAKQHRGVGAARRV